MLKAVLDRQQAQAKAAAKKNAAAIKNAAGHIMGKEEAEDGKVAEENLVTLKDDLAMLANSDGCWDDSDDEDFGAVLNKSHVTTTDESSPNESSDEPLDAWDLHED